MRVIFSLIIAFSALCMASAVAHAGPSAWPSKDQVFAEICRADIAHPEIVMRQAILETGHLKSPFLMNKNNLFGFKNKSYLSFPTWQDSVTYYKKWQDKRYTNKNEDYFGFLRRINYASGDYKKHVMSITWNKSCPN